MSEQAKHRFFIYGSIWAVVSLALDFASKWYILNVVMQPPQMITITSFFDIVLAWNPGVSFSMLNSLGEYGPLALSILAIGICTGLLYWMWIAETKLLAIGLGMVIGGALGNVLDRIQFSAVVDFLLFHVNEYAWPAFNIADTMISIGVGLILVDGFLQPKKEKKRD